jgi:hypothetical protein
MLPFIIKVTLLSSRCPELVILRFPEMTRVVLLTNVESDTIQSPLGGGGPVGEPSSESTGKQTINSNQIMTNITDGFVNFI